VYVISIIDSSPQYNHGMLALDSSLQFLMVFNHRSFCIRSTLYWNWSWWLRSHVAHV